ncbi:hypothetical protein N7462_009217 [Penicillium macrosclerotiorum]|uniref:uncharacterized protein n=1 Tax=Penicillium macrosclerotiorum TaxID=303699 RepID=UPI002549766B|nr:uncharacterized protein N7462_009217 [Penicillium macrosclerotiorum]KAJ5673778.1 hypothetical protein N7462_009217 [Penicillium macrosclerotiorum]
MTARMAGSTSLQPWAEGAEKFRGQRLLPHIIDYYAHHEPDRVFAAVATSESVATSFQDVPMKTLATAIDHMAWWLDRSLKKSSKKRRTLAYVGPVDLRYTIVLLAAIKSGWRTMFVSPQNPAILNLGLLQQVDVSTMLYADVMRSVAKDLQKFDPSISCKQVPSMADLLNSDAMPYPFESSWKDIKDVNCLVLHSSGSTGQPKLVYITHYSFSCTDNDGKIPVPKGRRPQNAALFNFSPAGRFYSAFPPYLMAGVQSTTLLPAFSQGATVVMGPPMLPPSGLLVTTIMKQQEIRGLFVPPPIIEQWVIDPHAYEQAEELDFVLYSGGLLNRSIGNRLDEVTDVCQIYGTLEIGHGQMLVPQDGEWEYMEVNPVEEYDFQELEEGEGLYELVIHANPKLIEHRALAHNFPDAKEWRTRDLFIPHPSKPGLWRFHSRTDDIISLATGYRVWPIPMETVLAEDPHISGALMVGNDRPEVLLLVEPRQSPQVDRMSKREFIDAIWPTIVQANAKAPEYGKIRRSRILLCQPNLGFFRTPKGTISRKPTESLYSEYIAGTFIEGTADEQSQIGLLEKHWLDESKRFIGSVVHDIRPDVTFKETDDFFITKAMDSLTVVELGQKLRLGLLGRMSQEKNTISFWIRTIFENPSIESLAKATLNAISGKGDSDELSQTSAMERMVEQLTDQLPEPSGKAPELELPNEDIEVVLLGSRGRLGPYLVKDLLDDPRVASIKCLDRGQNGRAAFQRRVDELGLDLDSKNSRLQFISMNLSLPNLGLQPKELEEISNNADVIIHNVWAVNFALSLSSFRLEMLKSLVTLVEIANNAPSRPRLVFTSSTGTVSCWPKAVAPNVPVPEEVIKCSAAATLTGYAQSKHVAERLLASAGARLKIPISILRIGQIAGPTTLADSGKWDSRDWMHSLSILAKATGLVPSDVAEIDWIPVDQVSQIVTEISLKETHDEETGTPFVQVYNVIHSRPVPFVQFADALAGCISSSRKVGFHQWVDHLAGLMPNKLSKDAEAEKTRILHFFQAIVQEQYPKFTLSKAKAASVTMASMEPIGQEMLTKWCKQWTQS